MSLFILEGIDKCGKTTLAAKLCKEYDATYLKFSAPKRDAYHEYADAIDLFRTDRNYVLDRYLYGELFYGPIYRGKSQITTKDVLYLETRLMPYNPILIICLTDKRTIERNFKRCKEELTKAKDIQLLMDGYEALKGATILPVLSYNYRKDPSHEELFDQLKLFTWGKPMMKEAYLRNHLGGEEVEYLFVGDEKNQRKLKKHVFDSTSGRFLLEACYHAKLLEKSAFCNSKVGSELVDLDYINWLAPRKVIALGCQSSKRLKYIGVKYIRIDHPQFAKRFYGKGALTKYINHIKEAVK